MKYRVLTDFLCPKCENKEKPHHAKGLCLDCYSAKKYREKIAKQSEPEPLIHTPSLT